MIPREEIGTGTSFVRKIVKHRMTSRGSLIRMEERTLHKSVGAKREAVTCRT